MKLKENWLTEGLIDFEYKKYILLAYLKNVKESFHRVELYPFLSDLVYHYRNLQAIQANKTMIYDAFPKELSSEDIKNLELNYRTIMEDDAIMREIESIIDFALPMLKTHLEEGSVIYEYVESKCEIEPIGVSSLAVNEGYLFITQPPESETKIYRYHTTIFGNSSDQYKGISLNYVFKQKRTLSNSYEKMKLDLIRQFQDLP
ncbi:MAG TPA: hypothetical protein DIW27_03810, partial [Cytophagales bacterium]|nr:hypothetical protein [Cytophagales bacterium]